MLAKSVVTLVLSFCTALAIAAPVASSPEGSVDAAAAKRADPLYWASTLLRTSEDKKMKRSDEDAALKDRNVHELYWASTLLRDGGGETS